MGSVAETKDSRQGGGKTMIEVGKDKNGGYVPAERLFVPAVAMPGIVSMKCSCYEHFIGELRRFTMVPLGVAIADEDAARQAGVAMQAQAAGEFSKS